MIAALKSQDRPVRLLAGGVFKGGDLGAVLSLIRERVRGSLKEHGSGVDAAGERLLA